MDIRAKIIQWIVAQLWAWALDHAWAFYLRWKQKKIDQKNIAEFKATKDREEKSKRAEDLLNGT